MAIEFNPAGYRYFIDRNLKHLPPSRPQRGDSEISQPLDPAFYQDFSIWPMLNEEHLDRSYQKS